MRKESNGLAGLAVGGTRTAKLGIGAIGPSVGAGNDVGVGRGVAGRDQVQERTCTGAALAGAEVRAGDL